jgi:hypothetical protein
MIEYSIAKKEHLSMILELYKQLIPEENPINTNIANNIWEKIENNDVKYFVAIENNKIISSCYLAIIPNLTRNGKSNGFIDKYIKMKNNRRNIK